MKKELTKYLASLTKQQLIGEIQKLYAAFPEVRARYEVELSEDTSAILKRYKDKIYEEYFPKRGYGKARSNISNKPITDYRKIANHPKDIIELLLFRTETMLKFTNAYGDIDEPFYNSLGSSYRIACELIQREQLQERYKIYCYDILESTRSIGWGLWGNLWTSYEENLA